MTSRKRGARVSSPSLRSETFFMTPFSKSAYSLWVQVRVCPATAGSVRMPGPKRLSPRRKAGKPPGPPGDLYCIVSGVRSFLLHGDLECVTAGDDVIEWQGHLLGGALRRSHQRTVGGAPGLHHIQDRGRQ